MVARGCGAWRLLAGLLSLALVAAAASDQDSCDAVGSEQQSASLYQIASAKAKVAFKGVEALEEPGDAEPLAQKTELPQSGSVAKDRRPNGAPVAAKPKASIAAAEQTAATAPTQPTAGAAPPSSGLRSRAAELWKGARRRWSGAAVHVKRAAARVRAALAAREERLLRSSAPGFVIAIGVAIVLVFLAFAFLATRWGKARQESTMPMRRVTRPQAQPSPPGSSGSLGGQPPRPSWPPQQPYQSQAQSRRTLVQQLRSVGSRASEASAPTLAPGLIVPWEKECILVLPRLYPQAALAEANIGDAARNPILRVSWSIPLRRSQGGPGSPGNRCLTLSSTAACIASCSMGPGKSMTILNASGKPFGNISAQESGLGFTITTRPGSEVILGLDEDGELGAVDKDNQVLAFTEAIPGNSAHRRLCIGPGVDVGLMTLAFLAIDLYEHMPPELQPPMGSADCL